MEIILLLIIAVAVFNLIARSVDENSTKNTQKSHELTTRCPTCGSQATVSGDTWYCDCCGDSGLIRRK